VRPEAAKRRFPWGENRIARELSITASAVIRIRFYVDIVPDWGIGVTILL